MYQFIACLLFIFHKTEVARGVCLIFTCLDLSQAIVLCLVAVVYAQSAKEAKIVNHQYEIDEDGTYDLL